MPQKILAGRCADPQLRGDVIEVKVDQVILSRAPARAFAEAVALGIKKTPLELAVAYDGTCVTDAASLAGSIDRAAGSVPPEMLGAGVLVARAGIGYPAPVHLERFASPARLALTDDPRLAPVGGAGMLALLASPAQLGQALTTGTVLLRPPRSVQVLLSGRTRPFVCARDVALELVRRGLGDTVRKIEAAHHAPVVIEFAGPSARLLSVSERAVLAGLAPQLGAVAALFVSDEKTEVFLRDQRRSKAHRALVPDPGAPCDDVVSIDLAGVDPLVQDDAGVVRPVRDLAGKPVTQVVLGGDGGATLRDLLAAAMLLKSKRVPSRLDFIVAPPSRQVLEVLAQAGALADLIATGARIIEPDARSMTGEHYPPPLDGVSFRTCDPEPGGPRFVVGSAETLAYAVATGTVGDPRSFKRPVRVTVPRALPTDDVLVARDRKGESTQVKRAPLVVAPGATTWKSGATLELVEGAPAAGKAPKVAYAVLAETLEQVTHVAGHLSELGDMKALIATFIPSGLVGVLAGAGVATFCVDAAGAKALKGQKAIALPALDGPGATALVGKTKVPLAWLAIGVERAWTQAGTSRPAVAPPRGARGG